MVPPFSGLLGDGKPGRHRLLCRQRHYDGLDMRCRRCSGVLGLRLLVRRTMGVQWPGRCQYVVLLELVRARDDSSLEQARTRWENDGSGAVEICASWCRCVCGDFWRPPSSCGKRSSSLGPLGQLWHPGLRFLSMDPDACGGQWPGSFSDTQTQGMNTFLVLPTMGRFSGS